MILDSGAGSILLPAEQYYFTMNFIETANPSCVPEEIGGITMTTCACNPKDEANMSVADGFPVLTWELGYPTSYPFHLPPASYLLPVSENKCAVLIEMAQNIDQGVSVLGLPFFENYYMLFDNKLSSVGLIESKRNRLGNLAS